MGLERFGSNLPFPLFPPAKMIVPLQVQDIVLSLTDVYTAAALRNERVLKALMKHAEGNEKKPNQNQEALYRCSREGDVETAKIILKYYWKMSSHSSEEWICRCGYLVGNAHVGNLDMIIGAVTEQYDYLEQHIHCVIYSLEHAAWQGHLHVVDFLLNSFPSLTHDAKRLRRIASFALKETVYPTGLPIIIYPAIVDFLMIKYGLVINPITHPLDRVWLPYMERDFPFDFGRSSIL